MPNDNDTKKLYDALQRDGYEDLGTLEEFTQKVQDRNNSDKLFNALQQDGYSDLGTQEDFYNRLHEAPAAKVEAPDTVEISGDGTFTEEQLAAVEAGAVPVVKQEPPAYGSPEWLQSRVADDINPSNPYNGMTRQEAINAIGKKYFNEWYGNGPGAYDKIKQEATYITDDPEVINHLPVDVRNTFISPVARKRIEQLMGSFKEVNWSNAEDILSVLDSRETQQAIESDLSKLGMRNTADMFDDAEAKEKAEADYRASRDAYYNTLREGLTGLLVEKYGYLPTTDARSDAGWLSSALIAGSGDAHEDRIRSREAVGLTQKYLSGDIDATIAQYNDVADAIVAEHNASVSPYADPGMDFGAIFAVRKGNEARDPDKVLEDLTSRAKTLYENMQGNEQFMQEVAKKAESLGMSTYHYLRQYVAPTFVEALQRRFQQTMIAREMPKSKVEYVLRGIEDSVLGMVARGMMYTDSQQQYRYMADAQTAAGGNPSVDPGIWAQGSRLATGMASDFWLWAGWGQLGSKLTGQLLSQRVSALAAEKGITEAAARRLLEEEGKHYLKKGVVEGMMRHIPSSAVTMGGAEGTTELVRSVRDNEKLGDIISNTMGATMRGATTGTAFGVTGGIMGRATSQLSGGWRLAGRLAGLEVEAGTMYTVEELHRMAAGEEAFENPFEGMLQTNIKLGFIKASANPIATIGKFAHALSHPVKTIKGAMKPDVGTLTEEDVTDLMQSQGGKDLVESITKMRPEKYNRAEGERQGAISREEAERAAEAYRNYMSDPERPFERKQRVARLLGGIVPPPGREVRTFSELLDDDTYVLRTYDIDGQCVRELHFKTIDELSAAENGMQADIDRNITESLAQKIDMYDSYQRYGTYLNEEYQRAAEKLRMGEELTDGERQVVYLYQHQGDLIDIRNKISDGEQLSQEEQRLGDIYEARFEDYVRSGKASDAFTREFEQANDLPEGTMKRISELHDRTEEEQLALASYRQAMRDRIAQYKSSGEASEASERSEARDTGERAGLLEARESGGANGEAGPQDEAGVHEPSAPTPTASYVRGQDAIKNGDADAVRGIGHDAYLAKARIERLFGNDQALMQQVFKAVEQGKAEDFLTANAETIKQPQIDAVRKLEDAFDAMRGVDDAVEAELSAIVRQGEEDIKPYQNEQGEIVPIKLVNGVTVYHKNGDLNNQYGTINIVYTGQDGQPKNAQVSYKDILEVAQPMSPEAFVERISQENRAATEQKYRKWAEGNDLSKGSSFEITVGGTIVPVHSEGLFANGDVQIAFEDGSIMRMSQADVLIGIAEAQKMRVDEEVNSEMAAWREQVRQRREEERAAAEKERQARFEKGIVGYGEGKPDYSSSDSDPAVVAEYLLSMAKSEGETGKVADSREQVLKNIQDEKELLLQNAMQFQRDFDEAQDWLDTNKDIADALEQAKAIQKRRRAEVKLDEIASRQLQWAAIRDQIMTKDEKESFMQERRHHLSTLRPKEITLPDNIQPYQTVYEENGIDVTKTEDIDKFLLDNYKEQGEAETAVNEQRIALRNYQRDHVQPDISRMQQVVDDYVQGRTELTDEVLTQLMTAIGEGEAYQSMLNQKARDLKAIVDRLPRTYAERNKAIFDEMPAADQRLSRFEQARTQQDKIRIAREVYGSDPVAAAYFDDMDVPLNAMELVAMNIPLRGISWEGYDKGEHHVRGLQEELGKNFTRGVGKGSDVNSFHTYLAPKGQGRGVDEVVHSIYEAQSDVDGEKLYDTQDIRNALIELITTASKPSDIRDYVIDRRIEAAEEVMRATEEYEAREAEMAEMGMPEQDDIDDWLTQQYKWLTPEVQNYFDGLYAEYVESLAGDPATYEDAIRQLVTQDAEQFNSIDYGRQRDNEAANGRGDRMDSVADTGAGEERGREGQEAVSGAQPDNEVRPVEHQEQVPAASGNESSLAGDAESVPVSKESGKRSTIQGLEDYTESEVKDIVRSFVEQQISESEADAEIVDIKIIGSRTTGNAKDGSDLDVLLEYKGTQREDDFFNLLHDVEEPLLIDGIQVDINPITKGKSGTIEEFMRRNADYSKEAPSFSVRLEAAKAETATNPTEEQKKAGNYKKGHITFGGYRMSIENPKGSVRSGVDRSGKPWSITMHDTYGYIGKKYGADGDHLDFFINDDADLDTWNSRVFIVDQKNEDGTFDEHKVLYGYLNWAAAKKAYEANYEPGWWDKHVMQMMGVRKPDFDKWLNDSDRKRKPFAEYFRTRILSETVSDPVTEVMADINDRQKVPTLNALGVREDTDLGKRFTSLKQKHPDTVLIFKTDGGFKAIGVDAPIVGQVASQSPVMVDGVQSVTFSYDDLGIILPALIKSGHHVAVSEPIEEPKAVKKLKIQGVSKKTQPKSGDTPDIDFMIGDIVSEDAPSEKISYKEYAFGNNFIPLQSEDVVTVVSVQRATMSATAPWREGVEDVTVHTTLSAIRKKYGELHQRAKEGDVEAADELVSSVVKPEKIAAIVAQHPNARVAYVHAEEATGRNSLPVAYAHQFKRQGLQLSDIVQTNKPEHTGSDRTGRFIRRARFNGEVESGREYIIVDDHITMGSTLRDLKDYIESKGGKVVAVSTLTASAGGTKLRPTEEQIHQLKEKGVTNEQLREIGIADNTEGLTRREAAEILVLVDKGRNSRSPRRREEERSRFGRSLGETQGKGVPERLADETRVIHLPRIDDNGYNVNTPIGRKMSRLKQEAGKAGLVGYTDSETGEYVFLGNDAEVIDQSIKLREKVSGKQDGMSMLRIPSDSFDLVTPTMVKKGYKIGIVDDKVDDVDRLIAESQRRVDVADKQEADKTISDYLKVHPQDSEAEQVKKRATKAVLTALDDAGVPYKLVSDKEEREMLSVFSQMNVEAIKTFARNPSIRNTSPHGRGRFIVFNMENPFGVPMYAEKKSVANWILEGVKKYGGKWAILDIGYPGEEQRTGINNAADMQAQIGWHGSHAVFTRFDHSHMGEGAGSQTFGWGTYLTNGRLVAQGYANPKFFDQLSYSSYLDDKKWIDENDTFEKYLANNKERTERVVEYLQKNVEAATDPDVKKFYEEEIDKAQERISESYYERTFATIKSAFDHKYGTGHLYKVEMPDDSGENYLEYYEKMRDQQAVMGKVDTYLTSKGWQKEQLDSRTRYTKGDKQIILTPNQSGADLYAEFEELYGAKGASKLLHEAGLTGIKYPAGTILGGGEGATNYVMFDEDDAKITEHYQMMMGDVTYPAASPSPVFVSNALKAVEGIKQEKATPEQWLAMLIKNGGLKAGEDKWLGLTEWLNEHKGQKLTKQDVIDFIHANQIEIEEQHYSESIDIDRNPKMVTFRQEYQASVDKYDNQRNEVSREIEDFNQQMYEKYGNGWSSNRKVLDEADRKRDIELSSRYAFLYNSDVEELAFSDLVKKYGNDFAQAFHVDYGNGKLEPREDMYGSVSQAAINFLGSRERPIQHIRLSYTTEELENKREIALTVPSIESWKEDDKIHFGDAGNGRAVAWIRFGDVTISEKSETHEASKQKLDAYHQRMHEKYGFTSDPMSWDMSVMTDDEIAEGDALEAEYERTFHDSQKKVLVIDEIQSKRHQEGREHGYAGPEREQLKKKVADLQEEVDNYRKVLMRKYIGPQAQWGVFSEGVLLEEADREEWTKLSTLTTELKNAQKELKKDSVRVPNAPFEKNWHELAMKRMLRYAAENGYDAIAWTTGQQQAARYNLSEVVERIDIAEWGEDINGGKLEVEQGYKGPSSYTPENDVEKAIKEYIEYCMANGESFLRSVGYAHNQITDAPSESVGWTNEAVEKVADAIEEELTGYKDAKGVLIDLNDGELIDITVNRDGKVLESSKTDYKGHSLSDIVGKEMALKIIDSRRGTISGEGLRIGGEGMKGFYDEILPRFMNKYGKRWGIKVYDRDYEVSDNGHVDDSGKMVYTTHHTWHTVDVTADMRESVMQGQPMFQKEQGGIYGWTDGKTISLTKLGLNPNSPVHEYTHIWASYMEKNNPDLWSDIVHVMKQTEMWEQIRKNPNYRGIWENENKMASEVLSRLSGAQSEEEFTQAAAGNKKSARELIKSVKSALKKFWDAIVRLFSGRSRTAARPSSSLQAVVRMPLRDLLEGFNPVGETSAEMAVMPHMGNEERTLMAVHNISEDKLKKAIKLGGLANPGLAVIDTKQGIHSDFGDISLIPTSALVDTKTGRNAGTYTGDAYTATYPSVSRELTRKGDAHRKAIAKEAANKFDKGNVELESRLASSIFDYIDGNGDHMHLLYMIQKGLNPKLRNQRIDHTHEEYEALEKIFGKGFQWVDELTDEQNDALLKIMMDGAEEYAKKQASNIKDPATRQKAINYVINSRRKALADENGKLYFAKWNTYVHDVMVDERNRKNPKIDWYGTNLDAANYVLDNKLQEDYEQWKEELFDDGDIRERLFAGWTPDGDKRYVTNTVQNASRIMNRESDTNAHDEGGLNATRSPLLTKMKTLSEIRKHRELLRGKDEYSAAQKEMSDELLDIISQLSDMQVIDSNSFMNRDYAEARLQEAITTRDPIGHLNREYGYNIARDSEFAHQIMNFIDRAKNLPVKYFETKFKRPVMLSEFAVAVVPETTSQEVIKALQDAGLDVRTYDNSSYDTAEANRRAVTLEAVQDRDDIMFQIGNDASDFSIRQESAPVKTQRVYKLMRLGDDGKLYPLFIDSATPTVLGTWYNADSPSIKNLEGLEPGYAYKIDKNGDVVERKRVNRTAKGSITGLPNVKLINAATNEKCRWVTVTTDSKGAVTYHNVGINGSGGPTSLAMRPGWHAGSLPSMRQIGKGAARNLRDDKFVWVEGEISADVDYQPEADKNPFKDIPTHIPENGYYMKATNANKAASQADRIGWYIAGAFKANRVISDAEARHIIDKWNAQHPDMPVEYDYEREGGKPFSEEDASKVNGAMTQEHDKQQEAWMVATQSVMRTLQDGKVPFDVVSQDEAARVLATQRSTGLEHGKQLLRTSSGVIYGYADHNGIHLTEAGINPETGAHEYGHLWVKALKRERPDLWSNIKSLMKEDTVSQRLYEKLLGNESYRQIHDDEDRLYEEVLTTMAGKKNRERFEQAAREMLEEAEGNAADTASGTSAVMRVLSRIRNAFHKLWSWVGKSLFGIKSFRSVDEVTDRMMYDFVNGTKLSPDEKSEADFQIGRGKPRQKKNESMAQYIQRLREWERRRIVEETDPEPQKPDNDTDPFSDDFRIAMDEWRRAHEEWEIRNQLREEENIDMRLYDEATAPEEAAPEESSVSAEQRESEALLESEVDARVMRDLGDAVGYDTTPEGVREHVRLAVIDRRKNLESASAEDALWLHDLSMRINEIAKHQGVKPQYLRDNLADIIEGTYFEDVLKDEDGNIVSIEDISDQLPVKKDDELIALLDDIKAWYDEFYHLIDEAGLRNDAGYIAEGYVNHVWDKAKSDPKAWDNYVRTRSANMKHREIETYREGRDIGLVPKYTDIIDILSHYSRQNNEAIANKTMLDAIAYTNVEEVNSDGEVVATVPLLTSREPDIFTREYYGKPYEIPSLGNVWVHRSSESIFATVFGPIRQQGVAPWVTKTGRFYDLLGSTLKKINLSLSGFHALALTETAIAQMGPVGTARALFKEILWDSALMGKGKPAYAHPEDFTFAAKHLVSLGATQDYAAADVQILTERLRNAVRNLAHDPNLMKKGAGYAIMPLTEALDFINKGMDAFLWDYIHDGLKVSCMRMLRKQIDRRAAKKDLPADMVEKMYDEAGQYVNDIFGGQYWELLNVSPATVKWAGRLIMSPDWNVSTTRQALAMTGFGSLYSEQGFKGWLKYHMDNIKRMAGKDIPHDEYRRVRSMNAKVFWLLSLPMIYAVMNALNAIARKGDEEEEQAKAEEMRKSNPDYKSPYELAHPEGMKWYDYFMFGNSIGQQTHLFNGRYIDGTERYIRWGKQFRELPEMFIGRHGVEFPTPMIERLMGKANPVIGYVRDGFGSLGVHGFTTPYDVKEDVAKHGKTIALLSVTAKRFLPYSVPTQEDKEFKFLDLFMPSSKGFSPWKAQDYYKTFILAGDMHGVEQTYQACVMNGIDAEKTLQAAIASIRANQRKELSDGVTDLGIAFDRFNETHDLLERRTLRNKIVKYLAEQSYKTFSREEALQKAQSVMDGENMAQAEKDADNYILACSAEDVRDDYRLTALMQQSKQYSDRLSQLRNEGIEEAVIKEYAERHGNWLQMRKMITAGRRQMNKLKKQLGQGNDETVMEQIRDVRGKLFIQIDGLDPQKK